MRYSSQCDGVVPSRVLDVCVNFSLQICALLGCLFSLTVIHFLDSWPCSFSCLSFYAPKVLSFDSIVPEIMLDFKPLLNYSITVLEWVPRKWSHP